MIIGQDFLKNQQQREIESVWMEGMRGLQFRQCGKKRSQMKAIFEKSTKEIRKGILPMGKKALQMGQTASAKSLCFFPEVTGKNYHRLHGLK